MKTKKISEIALTNATVKQLSKNNMKRIIAGADEKPRKILPGGFPGL
jgi:hypothetical protein